MFLHDVFALENAFVCICCAGGVAVSESLPFSGQGFPGPARRLALAPTPLPGRDGVAKTRRLLSGRNSVEARMSSLLETLRFRVQDAVIFFVASPKIYSVPMTYSRL